MRTNNKKGADAIEMGIAAHRAGRFDEALVAYQAARTAQPDNAEIASLMGLALVHSGRAAEALVLLNQAVTREPDQMGFRFNLAEGLLSAGDPTGATAQLEVILASNPDSHQAWSRLGDAAAARRDFDGAAHAWRRAFDLGSMLSPGLKLVRLELSRSRVEAAEAILDRLAALFPDEVSLRSLRCDCLIARRNWSALQSTAADWARVHPDHGDAWRALARAAFENGCYRDAVLAFRRVLETAPSSAADLATHAGLQMYALEFDAVAETLERAANIAPEHPGVLSRMAQVHMYYGRFDEAVEYSRRCLAREPENIAAYATLSRVRHGKLDPAELAVLERIAQQESRPLDQRIPAAFMVAHCLDATGATDSAFAAYEFAHLLALERDRHEDRRYEAAESEERFQRLGRLLPAGPDVSAHPDPGPRPVFIVGMPRSGTTLVECVVGAHSRVFPGGERMSMRQVLRQAIALDVGGGSPDETRLRAWAEEYLRDLPDLGGADHVTDKHPLNFEAIGLIVSLFPDAAIIHVRRNPVETCLSVYRQEFSKAWNFNHRLEDIGHFYSLQARLMSHWKRQLPGRIATVQYEEFAANIGVSATRLVQALGLAWESQCLEFQRSRRVIATFSAVTAREPVSVRNDRARRYGRHLGPLIDALEAGHVDLSTGGLRDESGMDDLAPS